MSVRGETLVEDRVVAESLITLNGGNVSVTLDGAGGRIVRLRHEEAGDDYISAATGPGGLEVYDELDRVLYSDLTGESSATVVRRGPAHVEFFKEFAGAPFTLLCRWWSAADGVRVTADAMLRSGEKARSVRISIVAPTTPGLMTWAPAYPAPTAAEENPTPYCYLADEKGRSRTGIPMLTLLHRGISGMSMVMPLEIPKVQLNMGVEPADPTPWYKPERIPAINAGAEIGRASCRERV